MFLPMMDSVSKPCKKGAKSSIRLTVGFTLKEVALTGSVSSTPGRGVAATQAWYLAGCAEGSATSTVTQASPCVWTDGTSEALE
jgi:hypothetical protein